MRVELEKSVHELLPNGIIKMVIKDGAIVEVEDIEEIRKTNLELSNGNKCVLFVDAGIDATVTAEARRLTSSKEHAQFRKAQAFVVRNLAQQILGNFYVKIQRPIHPTKMFTDEAQALSWLENHL